MARDCVSAYLGLRSLLFPSDNFVAADGRLVSGRRALTTALTVQLANPKLLLFLAALVPQFVDATRPLAAQFAVLGGTFISSDLLIYLLLAIFASRARVFWPIVAPPGSQVASVGPACWELPSAWRRNRRMAVKLNINGEARSQHPGVRTIWPPA